ncbi:MAG TPA: serine hydrolase [Baekduia sp.]|uniref:serine hydrolase n=1 Tax=Baekduia sp. TaxID=2600305 RepID=UPI002D7A3C02|nr:serine hydrolase [Baekduia sp.]HET6509739.1 serine hydrolase [Baekduia sp.]
MLATLATSAALAWTPAVADARAYARTRRGQVSFAVRTECGAWGRRQDAAVPSASVLKAMMLVAYLRRGSVRDRPLGPAQKALLSPMIRRSDDLAASRVFRVVGAGRLQRDARGWGMRAFRVRVDPWGDSRVTARDQARFWLHLDRRLPPRHRRYGLELLRTIVPSQRWGVARVVPRGWTLHFKGGWGSGRGAVDHQVALLTNGDQRVGLAILTTAQGTHAYGKATLEGVARRLLRGLDGRADVC